MYSREVNGQTLTFGVSGKLWKNALVMYDRETGSLWSHMTGECLRGAFEGEILEMVASVPIVKWKVWRDAHPTTRVLSIDDREERRRDNYRDYHASARTGLFPTEHQDRRLNAKDLVLGVRMDESTRSYPLGKKRWQTKRKGAWHLVLDELEGVPLLVYHDPENFASAVYIRRDAERVLEFLPTVEGYFAEDADGVRWNLLNGTGPEGKRMEPVPHLNVYWFAWVDFYPETELYTRPRD